MANQQPSIGRVVHYVHGECGHVPALIISPEDGHTVVLIAFLNIKITPSPVEYSIGSPYDETGQQIGSWHWPEYVPPKEE